MGSWTPALAAYPPGYNPRVEVLLGWGDPDRIAGFGWDLDATVDVAVNSSLVGDDVGTSALQVLTSLVSGDVVTMTGNDTGRVKVLTVADHQLTTADVPGDVVTGTTSPLLETQFFFVCPTAQGPSLCLSPAVEATGAWLADFGSVPFDFAPGMGVMVRQGDTDDDATVTGLSVPNPNVDIWDTHGVAASGWTPNAPLTITVDDPTDGEGPLVQDVTTNGEGNYWEPTPEGWYPLQPGWVATATGAVLHRETPTITKTLVVPDPIPVPDINDVVVSDTVTTALTDHSVGAGSPVAVIAWCQGGSPQGTTRSTVTDPGTGAFTLDMSADPAPPVGGFGDACGAPIHAVNYRLFDTDGDMFQAWWLSEVTPSLSLEPEVVVPGDVAFLTGTGWDLAAVSLVQCRLDGDVPDFPDGCDWSTRLDTATNPSEGWPYATAEFDVEFLPRLQISTGGGAVDCSTSGSCAVVGFEPWRPGAPMAWAPLTFSATLDVEGLAKGTVSTVTGSATVSGTLTASAPVWVHLSGELRQRFSRTRVVVGWFDTWVYVEQAGSVVTWSTVVHPQTGSAFGSGKAELTVWADQGDQGGGGDQDVVTVSLTSSKKK